MGDSRKSDLISDFILHNMRIYIIIIAFIGGVISIILVRKFCLSNEGDDEPPRIKK